MEQKVRECMIEEWKDEVRNMSNVRYMNMKRKYGMESWMKVNGLQVS